MKEVKIERTVYDVKYEAYDGTQFTTREECEKYDNTARAVLWYQFRNLVIAESDEYSLFSAGSNDYKIYIVKLSVPEDKQTVSQLCLLDNGWLLSECRERQKERALNLIDKSYQEKDALLVGENCEGEIYIIDTRNNIVDRLLGIDKKKEENVQ